MFKEPVAESLNRLDKLLKGGKTHFKNGDIHKSIPLYLEAHNIADDLSVEFGTVRDDIHSVIKDLRGIIGDDE